MARQLNERPRKTLPMETPAAKLTRVLQRRLNPPDNASSESSKPNHIIDVRCSRASALEWKLLIKNIAHDSLCF